jgi:hypothetical protein
LARNVFEIPGRFVFKERNSFGGSNGNVHIIENHHKEEEEERKSKSKLKLKLSFEFQDGIEHLH